MKKAFFLLLSIILLSSSVVRAEETAYNRVMKNKTIRCGYFTWPPYMFKDPNSGKLSGINYDVMEAVGRNLGMKINWIAEIGIGEVVTALSSGKFDVMCASIWPDQARMQNLTLTQPTFYSAVHAVARADDTRFDGNLDQANRKEIRVSGIDGDVTAEMAKAHLPNASPVLLPQTASGSEILLQVVNKKADLALVDEAIMHDFLKTNPGKLKRVAGIGPVRMAGEHLAVRRGEYHLRDMLDMALSQLVNDGAIDGFADKYARQYKARFVPPAKTFSQEQ